jgi:hypothetical protein
MLRLIAWLLSGYALYQLWTGTRRRQPGGTAPASADRRHIDRSQVVDAEFTDIDTTAEREA